MNDKRIDTINLIQRELFSDVESLDQIHQVRYLVVIEKIVNDLYDESQDVIVPLNKKYTKFARKLFCKHPDNFFKKYKRYSSSISINDKTFMYNLYKILKKYIYLLANNSIPFRNTLNSIYASYNNKDYYNMPLGYMDLNIVLLYNLMDMGCQTIGDLLKYTEIELKRLFDYATVNTLVSELNLMGLKFAEDLTIDQRALIMKNAEHDTIMNSSANWVNVTDYNINTKQILYRNCKTIHDLVDMISVPNVDVPTELLIDMKKLGFNLPIIDQRLEKNITKKLNYLDYNIYDLPIQNRTKNALYRNGIKDVKTLITYSEEELFSLKGLSVRGIEEIKSSIASLNLALKTDNIDIKNKSV